MRLVEFILLIPLGVIALGLLMLFLWAMAEEHFRIW